METAMTFHELTAEINRLEARERRQHHALENTRKLINSLRNLRDSPTADTGRKK